jgi:hypothetical protein
MNWPASEAIRKIIRVATLTIAKQNLLVDYLQGFDLLRKSEPCLATIPFARAVQPVGFTLS